MSPIDSGGMGEVYRARDTRLDRLVALKVIKDGFSNDPKRRARFEREAKVVSSLSHPNICQLYDVGMEEGIDYLVMELVEGQTLAQRLEAGSLPLPHALRIGAEIASALAAAHRQQVVHRDVKPSNVIVGRQGAKLVDFGLAKDDAQSDSSRGHTVTDDGAVPGTLLYMSPEQLSGERGDARSDLWALGAVLYEMATGRPAFDGARADVMSRILGGQADLNAVEHAAVRQIIAGCLTVDPDERWQSAQDIARQLRAIEQGRHPLAQPIRTPRPLLLASAFLLAVAAVLSLWYWRRPAPPPEPQLSIALPHGAILTFAAPCVAISPDGRRVAFIVRRNELWELYSRSLNDFRPTLLTQGSPLASVAFSPDGEWLAFGRGSKILKIRAAGGPEQVVADLPGTTSRGVSWGSDGSIYFSALAGGIFRSPPDGSPPFRITRPDAALDENSHRWPHAVPGGKHLLFTIRTGRMTSFDEARIALLSLDTGKSTVLLEGGTNPHYVQSGHLLFARGDSVLAVPLDLERGAVRGEPVTVLRGTPSATFSGAAHFDVAQEEGTLIYAAGGNAEAKSTFRVVDRKGLIVDHLTIPRAVDSFRVSPDGQRVAVQVSAANDDIWIWDRSRDALTRLSSLSGDETGPTWSPDGRMVYYSSSTGLYRHPVDQSVPERIVEGSVLSFAAESPRDGLVAYVKVDRSTRADIWVVDLDADSQPRLFAGTPHEEYLPLFSPDGQWLSYASNETGVMELYLGSVSDLRRVQVTSGGVTGYRWSRDGREIYYVLGEDFFAVPIGAGDPPEIGRPELMFRLPEVWYFDVLGEHFMMGSRPWRGPEAAGLDVIPGWGKEISSLVAAGKR